MRLRSCCKIYLAGWAAMTMCSVAQGVTFWLSSDAIDLNASSINESAQVVPGDPVVLTIWVALDDEMDNVTVISMNVNDSSGPALDPSAIWIFNPDLTGIDNYRHQTTIMSEASDFTSNDLQLADDHEFPVCNEPSNCHYWSPDDSSFGAASLVGFSPNDQFGDRHGLGVGFDARMHGDDGFEEGTPRQWKIGLVEFLPSNSGTTQLELVPGPAIAAGNQQDYEFESIPLFLTVEFIPDYDRDGDVDGQDYLAWQRGASPEPLSASDLNAWQDYYESEASSIALAIPEPSSILTLLVGFALLSFFSLSEGREYVRSPSSDCPQKVVWR